MASEWAEATLGDVTDFLSGGTPSTDREDYRVWVGSVGVREGHEAVPSR